MEQCDENSDREVGQSLGLVDPDLWRQEGFLETESAET